MQRTTTARRLSLSALQRENEQLRHERDGLRFKLIAALKKLNQGKRDPTLTPRILQMRTEGQSYNKIGRKLRVSYDTVRGRCRYAHQKRVAKKAI